MKMNSALSRYLREVKAYLPVSGKMKRWISESIELSCAEKLGENPGYNSIVAAFGAPEEAAAGYIESAGTTELLKAFRTRRQTSIAVIAAITIILVSWAAALTWAVQRTESIAEGGVVISEPSVLSEDEL